MSQWGGTETSVDFCVVGGGIVGLATANALADRHPGASIMVLEKEQTIAAHQTGHNSGVIHSGIYYAPGSLKARFSMSGAKATMDFCRERGIPVERCGKLLVATSEVEVERLAALTERAAIHGLDHERISRAELRRREPEIDGLEALFIPTTAIVDYRRVSAALAEELARRGVQLVLGARVTGIRERDDDVVVETPSARVHARHLVVCAGLQSDRLARLAGLELDVQIVPFRGEYYRLGPARAGFVKTLIYPVPDPELPFLGVHISPTIDGEITVGPSAVLGMAREGYPKFSINARDVAAYAGFPGLWRVGSANLRTAVREVRNSLFKSGYLSEVRKYAPSLSTRDLLPHRAGIRAQAVRRDGTLLHDFLIERTPRMTHVLNAPSPAATAAFPIGEHIAAAVPADGASPS
ncbi:L-2-hydroxyglutarate oxidase [Ruicaihuangia caeni]|uniref:L-2-hydroxyglutarate oxidase n=1 Tax=Ruicaihuangia caeni TaxID=3042517 RepID=UPI00338D6784